MTPYRIVLGILVFISGHLGSVSTQSPNVCKTFGSGVIQTFNNTMFHVKSTCPIILTHFSYAGVDCYISVQRDPTGLMKKVHILVNKIVTVIQDGNLTVEGNSVFLPYDNTYQSVHSFGIYTRLTSKVLPLSVTWYISHNAVTSLWVQLDRPLLDGMNGMCGALISSATRAQLLDSNVIRDEMCMTEDSQLVENEFCKNFKSEARECLGKKLYIFDQLCKLNMYSNVNAAAKCSFFEEFLHPCNGSNPSRSTLRNITACGEPSCPGDLKFKDQGAAFPPTCSNPQLQTEFQTSTCLPLSGLVLNDRAEGYHSVKVEDCPCVRGGKTYSPGQILNSKCQTCECIKGKWICSANSCPTPCVIEGWFVTTFDGKQYSLPGKCTYVAARGPNWTVTIKLSDVTIQELYLDVYQERYTFSLNSVQLWENEITITDLSQTEHVTVYWQSSMFVTVQTSFGIKMQVQVSPEVQMYLYLTQRVTTAGLCGSKNSNTEDDFTTSSGIVENSAQPFALSWTLGDCTPNNPPICINTDNEIFAEDKCSQLTNPSGVFAKCHDYVPVNTYFDACVQRTCHATSDLQDRACVGLGNYAKACASQGIKISAWREETACTQDCDSNLMFNYEMQACNRTCRSLSGPDLTCDMEDEPMEGCGCPSGTHLNTPLRCSPRALCNCHYLGVTTLPGPVVIDGLQCMCEYGNLSCSEACDCPSGKICVHCAKEPVNTAQRTCESLSKPISANESCVSGCYCPEGQFADHKGGCVTPEYCTCEFSGVVYKTGQSVESNCKTCTCRGGQWNCEGDPCPGVCEVFGNGQYKTFDSKWYRFGGHCQYTLVEEISGLFSIQAESVPCCDEVLTCSRSITVKLKDEVTLILRDMNVTQKLLDGWHFSALSLYSVHTVGLYIIISVPEMGLTVIWDKQTRVKIELEATWNHKVRGLCGDFDGKLMNDLLSSSSTLVFSTLEFGNSWKTAVPPCSDVTEELFPCERHSYCASWAQRRCMIIHSDTFKDCHLKVDPAPYYQACILESCSCDFEGKFLGFCTAVAAYADACTTHNVCIKWRTPDLCPVYCDYYNEEGQSSWHYEACPQQIKTCGKNNKFYGELEGCYPRCPAEMPYYDENRRICSSLDNCTCYFNNTVVTPGSKVTTASASCDCIGGEMICSMTDCCDTMSTPISTTTRNTHVTTLTTPVYTTTTELSIKTGPTPATSPSSPQVLKTTAAISYETPITTSTPEITTLQTTTTSIPTETLTTTITTTPAITTVESVYTTSLTTTETPVTTSTPKITTVQRTTTSIPTETPTTTTTTTPEITTEESTYTTLSTTETQLTTKTSITDIYTTSTTSLTATETPVTTSTPIPGTSTTTYTLGTTSEESSPTITFIISSAITGTPIISSTPEITAEESTLTTSLTTTTETPVTTSTAKSTTETPVTNTITTPEITNEESTSTTSLPTTTETPVIPTTTKSTTVHTTTTSLITSQETPITTKTTEGSTYISLLSTTETPMTNTIKSTTIVPEICKDPNRNQSWPDGYQWIEDCFNKACTNGVIELRPLICPTPVMPVCPRGTPQLVKDEQGCCDTWQCDCQCDVFGDPHYTSFAGQNFMFLENCTYILVEERTPHHLLSISVDNYYCEESASCAKGIILKYGTNTVVLQVVQHGDEMPVLETTLNEVTIMPPYEADGFRFVSTDAEVYIYIKEIRSSIFLSIWNTLQINLAMEHFYNNTQGQCGVCGGPSCIRRDGSVESEDCCDKTAYEWIEDDPLKPYCKQARQHVPCVAGIPPSRITPTVPICRDLLCDLLTHEVFSECSEDIDVEKLVRNCNFDYCVAQNNDTVCSPLERLADHCKKKGFCVAWRNLTYGICDIPCPEGMIFEECRSTPSDFCSGGVRVPGTALDTVRSGCFCPDNQVLAESHKKICVSECTNCKGPLGEPMPAGAMWESNCHICTCNNQTLTEDCKPTPPTPTPVCSPGSALITDCCNNQICVEKTCEYNEMLYKVGETWRDPNSPCVTLRCTTEGTEIEKSVCPQQFCPEELRVWDEHHCCYSCNTTCGVRLSRMTVENCTQEVILPTCEGNCASGSLWVRSGKDLQLERNQFYCRERNYELRQVTLVCSEDTPIQYTYKHITSCECQLEV